MTGTKKQDPWDVETVDKNILIGLNDAVQLQYEVTWDEQNLNDYQNNFAHLTNLNKVINVQAQKMLKIKAPCGKLLQ